jgi:molybdopterin-binding protein
VSEEAAKTTISPLTGAVAGLVAAVGCAVAVVRGAVVGAGLAVAGAAVGAAAGWLAAGLHALTSNTAISAAIARGQVDMLDPMYQGHASARHTRSGTARYKHTRERSRQMEISARNQFKGKVTSIVTGGVMAEVTVDIGHGMEVVSVITRASAERLGLKEGSEVTALIKSSEVLLAR